MKLRLTLLAVLVSLLNPAALWAGGRLEIRAVDAETNKPLAVRMYLKNAQGKPVKPAKLKDAVVDGDSIVFYDKVKLDLPTGGYEFQMERGLEYKVMNGTFEIQNFADDTKTVPLTRFCDMTEEGWYSGDLDVERPEKDLKLLMQADDVHLVPLVTWTNTKNPWAKDPLPKQTVNQFDGSFFYSALGGELTTPGNVLRLFRLDKPLELPTDGAKALGSLPWLPVVEHARKDQHAWVDAGAFFARDLPIWIAAGQIDSVQLANRHLLRDGVVGNEAGGWPRDNGMYPNPQGNGRWSQEIYYDLLNCGLRIPATAGSGAGADGNPVGYNRVYVHLDPELSAEGNATSAAKDNIKWDKWWEALRSGRVMVTNGPLIRPNVNGELPGHVFKVDAGQAVELLVGLTLSTRERIRYLEVVKNGRSEFEANLDEFKSSGGKLPPLKFTESGWFLVRAVTENAQTYRYASTGAYYVEIGYQPRISRRSAQFFLDWTNKRAGEIAEAVKNDDSPSAQTAKRYVEQAQAYWQGLLDKSNAE